MARRTEVAGHVPGARPAASLKQLLHGGEGKQHRDWTEGVGGAEGVLQSEHRGLRVQPAAGGRGVARGSLFQTDDSAPPCHTWHVTRWSEKRNPSVLHLRSTTPRHMSWRSIAPVTRYSRYRRNSRRGRRTAAGRNSSAICGLDSSRNNGMRRIRVKRSSTGTPTNFGTHSPH